MLYPESLGATSSSLRSQFPPHRIRSPIRWNRFGRLLETSNPVSESACRPVNRRGGAEGSREGRPVLEVILRWSGPGRICEVSPSLLSLRSHGFSSFLLKNHCLHCSQEGISGRILWMTEARKEGRKRGSALSLSPHGSHRLFALPFPAMPRSKSFMVLSLSPSFSLSPSLSLLP